MSFLARVVRAIAKGVARAAESAVESFVERAARKGLIAEVERLVVKPAESVLRELGFSTEPRQFVKQLVGLFELGAAGEPAAVSKLVELSRRLTPEQRRAVQKVLEEWTSYIRRRGYATLAKVAVPAGAVLGAEWWHWNVDVYWYLKPHERAREVEERLRELNLPESTVRQLASALVWQAEKEAYRKYGRLLEMHVPGAGELLANEAIKIAREWTETIASAVKKVTELALEKLRSPDRELLRQIYVAFRQKYRGWVMSPEMRLKMLAREVVERVLAEHPEILKELEEKCPVLRSIPAKWLVEEAVINTLARYYGEELEKLLRTAETVHSVSTSGKIVI